MTQHSSSTNPHQHTSATPAGGAPDGSAAPTTTSDVPGSPTRRPGGTGRLGQRSVARVGYGAMGLERLREDPDRAVELVRRAVDLGIDHIDTAQFYGHGFVNEVLGRALRSGDDVAVVSKVGAMSNPDGPLPLRPAQRPAELRAEVEHNLRALGRDQLEVVNLRRLDVGPGITASGDQIVDLDDQLAEMIALRDEGKIGAIGLSAVAPDTLRRALGAGIVCVQNGYNLISREFEDMLALCSAEQIAWVPYFPLGSAFDGFPNVADDPTVRAVAERLGATPAQVALAWLLHHDQHILLIPGTASIAHLEDNVAAGDLTLDAQAIAELDAVGADTVTVRSHAPFWLGDRD